MVARPVTLRLHAGSRIAAVGVAAVLVVLSGFAIWSSNRSVDAASQMRRARLVSDAYVNARFAMDDERLLEHQYMVGHGGNYNTAKSPDLHARFDSFAAQATGALGALQRLGGPADRSLATHLLSIQREYQTATDEVFAAAQVGNASMARMQGSVADQSFAQLNAELAAATESRSSDALASLNALQHTERSISTSTIETVPVAVIVVAAFALVLRAYRRRVQEYNDAELERLKQEALIDSLTHLRNHRAFEEDLDRALAQADRATASVTLVGIDLDSLKRTNDALGHPVGDERLKALAEAARRTARAADGAYRVGGDEFALILADTRASGGEAVVRRMQAELSQLTDGRQTATAGLAEFGPGMTRDELIHNADVALLEAKASQRPTVIFSPELERSSNGQTVDSTSLPLRSVSSALARAVDAKDSMTRSHSETVANSCVLIANELGLDPERTARLRVAGLLHDVGKIGIPDRVLNKPGPLTEDEWEIMKTHPVIGHGILLSAGLPEQATWVLYHHERLDGRGYPDALSADKVPLESRIILVADAFEAMTSNRPYREGRPERDALDELERHSGSQFDPKCVQALRAALERVAETAPAATAT